MRMRKFILIPLLCLFAFLCAGCVENTNTNNSSANISLESNVSSNSTNLTNIDSVEINESVTNENTIDINSTINADSVENYDIATANNAFAFDMYSKIIVENEQNVFFSPYSIFTAIAMCYDGAENSTEEQIANVFNFPLNKTILEISSKSMISEINSGNGEYELETANALWIQTDYPIKNQYISNVGNYYSGKVTKLNFVNQPENSRVLINDWIENKTNDKIKDPIPNGVINSETRLILTNTIYFNGIWKKEFDIENTQNQPFYPSKDEEISVETMYAKKYFSYGESSNAKILELPYKGNDLYMYIVLPNENEIGDFETSFSLNDYNTLKSNMDSKYEVRTWLPKFKFETKTDLSNSLIKMGMIDAFDDTKSTFSGISDEKLTISNIVHQAFVDVQEEGTEAAATTVMYFTGSPAPGTEQPEIVTFKADHPFIFLIEDKRTGCILFMGKVESPEYDE
ncbi:serpin family protein [Methanolobus vulcani]|uniref:Serpin family protein n=1 Tax=Methanolobus vulcani TaxID=38026 RepID=A0A7Z8P1C1_9EURY|nr:serpin family protein [Methanolobus vulcani]TQD23988.1 serpin family protein [Methanolobus vulcani]